MEFPLANLELESRLITHGHAVEHVAWRRTGPVSLGAFRHIAKRPRAKNPCGHGRCQGPFLFRAGWHGQHRPIFGGDRQRLRRLINPQCQNGSAHQHCRNCNRIRSEGSEVERQNEIARSFDAEAPERLAQKFVALAAMKFVKEVFEVSGRRLFVFFQPKQF